MTGTIPADVAIIHIIIKAMGIQEKKSRFISPGNSLTSKAKTANPNIEIVNTISEYKNIVLGLTFRIKKGVIPRRNMYLCYNGYYNIFLKARGF